MGMKRRDFLQGVTGMMLGGAAAMGAGNGNIPHRKLGKTGMEVSAIAMGGIVVMNMTQKDADGMVRWAYDNGVTYFDVAPTYGDAEERLGPALKGLRDKIFLACKTEKRDRQGAADALHQSLKRLQTDYFDLYQLHALKTLDDVEKAFAPDGAMAAFLKAREKGLIRFIGFSAHSEEAALAALERFPFDTVMFPINFVCLLKNGFGQKVISKAQEVRAGIIAIKGMAKTYQSGERKIPKCWYEPVDGLGEGRLALNFTLSQPIAVMVPPGNEKLFQMAVQFAKHYRPPSNEELDTLKRIVQPLTPLFPLKD